MRGVGGQSIGEINNRGEGVDEENRRIARLGGGGATRLKGYKAMRLWGYKAQSRLAWIWGGGATRIKRYTALRLRALQAQALDAVGTLRPGTT